MLAKVLKLLCISQVFPPDPAAVGQYFQDLFKAPAFQKDSITVLAANRGYENPEHKFSSHTEGNIRIIRLPLSSFGKKTLPVRIAGAVFFIILSILRGLFISCDTIVVSTSPPFAALSALALSFIKSRPIVYWVNDINPDQALALGLARAKSLPVKLLDSLNRLILRRSTLAVTLDSYMADLLQKKTGRMVSILPLWPLAEMEKRTPEIEFALKRQLFREKHRIPEEAILFMYSGNWNRSISLLPLARAVWRLRESGIHLILSGAGSGRPEVEEFAEKIKPDNITLLPFQPLAGLNDFLSQADIHIVLQSGLLEGILHPSKVYNALAQARPVFFIGPAKNFFLPLLERHDAGWFFPVDGAEDGLALLLNSISISRENIEQKSRAALALAGDFKREKITARFHSLIKDGPGLNF